MDDPLIGLTIYDTTKSRSSRVDPGKLDKSCEEGSNGTVTTSTREPGRSDETKEECFPCLPSISEDLKMKSAAANASEEVVHPELSENGFHQEKRAGGNESQPRNYWLMRLFQSNLFDMSIAIGYLFNSKDYDVQSYLGNRLLVSVNSLVWYFTLGGVGVPLLHPLLF